MIDGMTCDHCATSIDEALAGVSGVRTSETSYTQGESRIVTAPEGSEQIMEATLAIRHAISVSDLAAAFHPYLTQAEGIKLCAQTFGKDVSKLSCCAA